MHEYDQVLDLPFGAGCQRCRFCLRSERLWRITLRAPLLFSKMAELKGYALRKIQGKSDSWKVVM